MDTSSIVMKVFAARAYTFLNPRETNYVDVNIPEVLPTVPQDNQSSVIAIANGYTANSNYPVGRTSHSLSLPLLRGTTCPVIFRKSTPFLLFSPTGKYEEGYLLYI